MNFFALYLQSLLRYTILYRFQKRYVSPRSFCISSNIGLNSSIMGSSRIFSSKIGNCSYVNNSVVRHASIGNYSSIAPGCLIGLDSHPISRLSTSPIFYSSLNPLRKSLVSTSTYELSPARVLLGHDVWVGANSIILPGVSAGNGSIIGCGSVLTRDIEDYSIVCGNPAKLIRKRFPSEICAALTSLQWWNYHPDQLAEVIKVFELDLMTIDDLSELNYYLNNTVQNTSNN